MHAGCVDAKITLWTSAGITSISIKKKERQPSTNKSNYNVKMDKKLLQMTKRQFLYV